MEEKKENVIVPAYMKNQKKDSENKIEKGTGKNKKKKLKLNKKFYILIAAIILTIVMIVGITFLVRIISNSKYNEYSKKMDVYGLSDFFDNGKSTSYENVTKGEAIKIILTSILNIDDITKIIVVDEEYKNQTWIEMAVEYGAIKENEINEKNINDKITYIEYITYFQNARKAILKATLDTSVYPKFTDISNIQPEQLYALSEMVSKELIENVEKKLKPNRVLYKGEFSKVTLEIGENYNILIPTGKKISINGDRMPSNKEEYPYILFDVSKEVYEKPLIVRNEEKFKSTNEIYKNVRTNAIQIMQAVENYYNAVLNVDYEKINSVEFQDALFENAIFEVDEDIVEDYINYVKQNKIKLSGTASTQMPIIYNDGYNYRLRTKISFEILNSDTQDNILYYDDLNYDYTIKYENKKYEFFIDAVIGTVTNKSKMMYVWEQDIYSQKTDEKIDGITTISKKELNIEQ